MTATQKLTEAAQVCGYTVTTLAEHVTAFDAANMAVMSAHIVGDRFRSGWVVNSHGRVVHCKTVSDMLRLMT